MIFTVLRLLGLLGVQQQKQKNKKARRAAGTGAPNCHLLDPALSIPTMFSGDSIYGVVPTTTTTTPNPTRGTTGSGALIAMAGDNTTTAQPSNDAETVPDEFAPLASDEATADKADGATTVDRDALQRDGDGCRRRGRHRRRRRCCCCAAATALLLGVSSQ